MYVYFQDVFDLLNKQTLKIDILYGEIISSDKEKITHVCVSLCVWCVSYYLLYSVVLQHP